MKNSYGLTGAVALSLALAAGVSSAAAEEPKQLVLLTERSAEGGFVFELWGGSGCDDAASAVQVRAEADENAELAVVVTPLGAACSFAATPEREFSPGRYCVGVSDYVLEEGNDGCFEVSTRDGRSSPPTGAPELVLDLGVSGWTVATPCAECGDLAERDCTRDRLQREGTARLANVAPELASSHAFAFVSTFGEAPLSAASAEDGVFIGLSSDLTYRFSLRAPDAGEESCLTVFRRELGNASGDVVELGRACLPIEQPVLVPAQYTETLSACADDYTSRWCDDNAAACEDAADERFYACYEFDYRCRGGAKPPERHGHQHASPRDVGEHEHHDAGAEAVSDDQGGGCSVAKGETPNSAIWLSLVLVWLMSRRRRDPHASA